jgi:hypothetical protein
LRVYSVSTKFPYPGGYLPQARSGHNSDPIPDHVRGSDLGRRYCRGGRWSIVSIFAGPDGCSRSRAAAAEMRHWCILVSRRSGGLFLIDRVDD